MLPQELVYGVVREAAAPTPGHQWAVGDIYHCLRPYLEQRRLGRIWVSPIDVVLDRERGLVVQPDVLVVLNPQLHLVTDRVWGAPDLVVEVMTPHLRIGTLDERLGRFAKYGVGECWLVRHLVDEFEIVSFGGGVIAERKVFAPHDRLQSRVLLDLAATPAEILTKL
ncbi:MAG: Uma2 family endonuclease [Vicinamibacterales bacterium]